MKRDIKINYGDLKTIREKVNSYIMELDELEINALRYLETIEKQKGDAFIALSAYADTELLKKQTTLRTQLEDVLENIDKYISEMTALVAPKDELKMTQVDRDDVWFNYEQIHLKIDSLYLHKADIINGGIYCDQIFIYNPLESKEENDTRKERIDAENAAAKRARENNYNKLAEVRDSILGLADYGNECIESIKKIHDDYLTAYENKDDSCANEIDLLLGELTGFEKLTKFKHDIWSFILDQTPPSRGTVGIMELLSNFWNHILLSDIIAHLHVNESAWKEYQKKYANDVYIERQNEMYDFEYGKTSWAFITNNTVGSSMIQDSNSSIISYDKDGNIIYDNGNPVYINHTKDALKGSSNMCEIIATYNALLYLNLSTKDKNKDQSISFPGLVSMFEISGAAINGNFGTSMSDIATLINSTETYNATMYYANDLNKSGYEQLSTNYDAFILSTYNGSDITSGVHTMAVTAEKDDSGRIISYTIHNDYSTNNPPRTTYLVPNNKKTSEILEKTIKSYNNSASVPISIIGVKRNEE